MDHLILQQFRITAVLFSPWAQTPQFKTLNLLLEMVTLQTPQQLHKALHWLLKDPDTSLHQFSPACLGQQDTEWTWRAISGAQGDNIITFQQEDLLCFHQLQTYCTTDLIKCDSTPCWSGVKFLSSLLGAVGMKHTGATFRMFTFLVFLLSDFTQ